MANNVQILSTDGRSLRDAPASSQRVSMIDELAGFKQRLDAVLPAVRPRERLGGLATARAAEREKARVRIESQYAIDRMRAAGKNVKAITEAHKLAVETARADPFLSAEGRAAKVAELRQMLDVRLEENANNFKAAESELLTSFHGRSKAWLSMRDKGAVAATQSAAVGLASIIDKWTPEQALERLEQAINERDVVTLHYVAPVVKNLLSTDTRYETLQGEAETLLEDAKLAIGDEDTDAAEIAAEISAEMRAELSGASKLARKNEQWDPVLDSAGILQAFDSPHTDGETSAA